MKTMTKSELIERLSQEQPHLPPRDVEFSVNAVLDHMRRALVAGDRIEIRGFGSIGLRYRMPRTGRNPKTGEDAAIPPGKRSGIANDARSDGLVETKACRLGESP